MGKLEDLRARGIQPRAVAYARYSSNNQREESIDAQLRAIYDFAKRNGIEIVGEYCDKAKSATTDIRPEFQNMVYDAKRGSFNLVIVHKLDRFARNRSDSIGYRVELKKNGVELLSVLEGLNDNSAESVILESLLEAMAEYHSKNLSREVMKGMTENALKCMHTGGLPPLGYNINPQTRKYELNTNESVNVRFIFRSVIEGKGYKQIIHELNSTGAKTKRGHHFAKDSLFEILRNEKYRGVYIFYRSATHDAEFRRNNHASKSEQDIIRIPDGVPRIVSDEEFFAVQKILKARKRTSLHGKAKETYLLSGKIYCGECGSVFCGNRKMSGRNKRLHVTYRCNNRSARTNIVCENKEINRDYIEQFVLEAISEVIFNDKLLPSLITEYNTFVSTQSSDVAVRIKQMERKLKNLDSQISNITAAIAASGSLALVTKLEELEGERNDILTRFEVEKSNNQQISIPDKIIESAFFSAKMLFQSGELAETRELINLFVERVTVYMQHIDIEVNVLHLLSLTVIQNNNKSLPPISQEPFIQNYSILRNDLNKSRKKHIFIVK